AAIAAPWDALSRQVHSPLRTYFEVEDEDSANLPWEFVSKPDPQYRLLDIMSFRPQHFMVRAHAVNYLELCKERILRILIVTGAEYLDAPDNTISAEQEVSAIGKAFQNTDRAVHIEVLRRPQNLTQLLGRMQAVSPHVLHFIGHGGKAPASNHWALWFDQ